MKEVNLILFIVTGYHSLLHRMLLLSYLGRGTTMSGLLHRASRDGSQAETFHARCDNKGTLAIVSVGKTHMFGGCNHVSCRYSM